MLRIDIKWKYVVLGFHFERNAKTQFLNTPLSILEYKIFKFKMTDRCQNKSETTHHMMVS